ncbi:hypothetical protein INT48_000130 [Thamnidium elegans]|uniref:Uncharacterized protein n=1 Tax=Thamnidium elegans TaxID=101142 RepID=A0A8H7SUS7_9FUNG|nr:hypothetical protein INT48_000130 [Thamnidium elegans]
MGNRHLSLNFSKFEPVAGLRFDEPVGLKHMAEIFGRSLYLDNINTPKKNQDTPYMISVAYHGYSSSLYFEPVGVGNETKARFTTVLAEPMTLCRF